MADNATIRTTVMLGPVLHENMKALCARDGITQSQLIRRALRAHLKAKGLQPTKHPKVVLHIVYE